MVDTTRGSVTLLEEPRRLKSPLSHLRGAVQENSTDFKTRKRDDETCDVANLLCGRETTTMRSQEPQSKGDDKDDN
jgi:hypothetical protein